ncbi:Lrp/AsnC family transcriptional regulator [Sphingomonas montanisoli]|uniref:Lrp/AsnC family transcriptional regulator n=1 Tax=Sphingomonas montanisoli TaxID=2606412 RepID=A0A5D9C684_9SPHN|nr:Lrp/AsnC family transcriptional regulator [Sphingomonas montanisoli]TZG27314.1 Lrp/AsnC family transcriptional regulator [Sphingomonas montanisoli]
MKSDMARPKYVSYTIDNWGCGETRVQIKSRKTLASATLDTLDHRIIETLRSNGRITNQEIAARISVTAATVSARLKRLDEIGAARVVAVADFAALGHNVLMTVGIKVAGRDVLEVAQELAKLSEALSVAVMNGPCDIEMLIALHGFDEAKSLMLERISTIAGIDVIEAAIAVEIPKFKFNIAPLL